MLAYAFQVLEKSNYDKLKSENFADIEDLLGAIISIGVSEQLKSGLYKEYISVNEDLRVLRGRLNLTRTIRKWANNERQWLSCEHDEFSADNIYNQILKTTIHWLVKSGKLKNGGTKMELRNLLRYFDEVHEINLGEVKWQQLKFHRNNQTYKMLIYICYLLYGQMLMEHDDTGKNSMDGFLARHLEDLYEKFILAYYQKEHPEIEAAAPRLDWDYDKEKYSSDEVKQLPIMRTDVTLKDKVSHRVLIIDAKYYPKMLSDSRYEGGENKVYSGHLYQIFAYVKNMDAKNTGKVSGLLLYAKIGNKKVPDLDLVIGGNRIAASFLDLDVEFVQVVQQLENIKAKFLDTTKK